MLHCCLSAASLQFYFKRVAKRKDQMGELALFEPRNHLLELVVWELAGVRLWATVGHMSTM